MIHRVDLETASLQKIKGSAPSSGANQMAAALLAHDLHNGTVYEALARMRLAEGNAAGALDMITRAQALRPHQAEYRRLEGDIRRAMGDRPAAVAAYRRALSGIPSGTPVWLGVKHRLIVTLIETGDYGTAIDEANDALAIAPGDALTRRLLDAATEARRARTTGS
jgi:Flp pilus assembly protein TadD